MSSWTLRLRHSSGCGTFFFAFFLSAFFYAQSECRGGTFFFVFFYNSSTGLAAIHDPWLEEEGCVCPAAGCWCRTLKCLSLSVQGLKKMPPDLLMISKKAQACAEKIKGGRANIPAHAMEEFLGWACNDDLLLQ